MKDFLYTLCNQAVLGGVAVAAVCLVRLLLTRLPKKAPRYLVCLLWLVVAVRLLCPVSLQTPLGLLTTDRPLSNEALQAEPLPTDRPAESVGDTDTVLPITPPADNPTDSVGGDIQTNINTTPPADGGEEKTVNTPAILFALWAAGAAGLLLYGIVEHWRLRRRVGEAVPEETQWGRVYRSESIRTPFVLGLLRPRVYVPVALPEADLPYVVAHEQAHVRRGDPWYKVFAYLLLTVFWFQPLCWLAFCLLCRDLEVACDERVMKTFGDGAEEQKKAYSAALLGCVAREQGLAFCPVAFGGTDVGGRIKNILHYKKPVLWLTVTAAAVCVAVGIALLTTRPARQADTPLSSDGLPVQGQVTTTTTTTGEQTTTASTDTTETTTTTTTKKATSTTPTTAAPTTTTTTTKKPTMTTPATTDTILPFIPLDNAKKEEVLELTLNLFKGRNNPERPEIKALTTDDVQFIYYNTYQETVAFDMYIKGREYTDEVRTVTVAGCTFHLSAYCDIVLYKGGLIKNLSEAYAAGWLSKAAVQDLKQRFDSTSSTTTEVIATATKKHTTATMVNVKDVIPGTLNIAFTVEATSRYTDEDYTIEALEQRFGIEIDSISDYPWYDPVPLTDEVDELGNKMGRPYAWVSLYIPQKTEEETLAVAKKVGEHPDVSYAKPDVWIYLDD